MKYNTMDAMKIFRERKSYDDLTIKELCILDEERVFNGCGAKGGVSFDEILEMVEKLHYFNKTKFERFHRELKAEGCKPHDYKYWLGGKWYHKVLADIVLSNWIFCNLTWAEWYIAPATWLASMIGLTRYGNKSFNFH